MSLSGLTRHIKQRCERFVGTASGSRNTLRRFLRGDDVYANAVAYLNRRFPGQNVQRLAMQAIQDLVDQRVLSLYDTRMYSTFSNSNRCYLFLTGSNPSGRGRRSNLPAREWIAFISQATALELHRLTIYRCCLLLFDREENYLQG